MPDEFKHAQRRFVVTRQHYYYADAYVVEVETGGWDLVGPGWVKNDSQFPQQQAWLRRGCDQAYADPREAARVAFEVWRDWQEAAGPHGMIYLSWGTTGSILTEHDPMDDNAENPYWTPVQLFMAADRTYAKLPRCDWCGNVLGDPRETSSIWLIGRGPDDPRFCSESCGDSYYLEHIHVLELDDGDAEAAQQTV
jgi:hypothetical protein